MEILETAFSKVIPINYSPWKIRNLLISEVVVYPFIFLGAKIGITSTFILICFAHIPFIFFSCLNTWLVYKLANIWLKNDLSSLLAAIIYVFHPITILYGCSMYPRVISTSCILAATILVSSTRNQFSKGTLAGCLMALAFSFRYSEIIYILPLFIISRHFKKSTKTFISSITGLGFSFFLFSLITVGLNDYITWGEPFSSLLHFWDYTIVKGLSSSRIAKQSVFYYLKNWKDWIPSALLIFFIPATNIRINRSALSFLIIPLIVLSIIHHKEIRYLQPVIPYLIIIGSSGIAYLLKKQLHWLAFVLIGLTLITGLDKGMRFIQWKSIAACEAARSISSEPGISAVAFSQAWAYGDLVFFDRSVKIKNLSVPPSVTEIESATNSVDFICLYKKNLENNSELLQILVQRKFHLKAKFEGKRCKDVWVFERDNWEGT